MIKSALELLIKLAQPVTGATIETPVGSILVPYRDGQTTAFKEIFGPEQVRINHAFSDISSLVAWLKARTIEPSSCDVIATRVEDGIRVVGITSPEPLAPVVSARHPAHPLYAMWSRVLGRQMTQKGLYTALRPLAATIVHADGAPEGTQPGDDFLRSIRRFVVQKGTMIEAELRSNGSYAVRAKSDKTELSITLPESLVIRIPVFRPVDPSVPEQDQPLYDIELSLELNLDGPEPTFTLTAPLIELNLDKATTDAVETMTGMLGGEFLVTRGQMGREIVRPR